MGTNKIAVLVSGTYREIEFLLNIFPQIMEGIDHDIYVVLRHTDGEVSRLGTKEADFKLPQGKDNVFMCELPSIDKAETKSRYLIPVGPTDEDRECAILSMFQGVFTAISMMKASLRKYDYVMKTRTDYLPPMTLREMIETYEKTNRIIVDGCANWSNRYPDRLDLHWHGSLNDIFCFAPYDNFLKLWDFEDILPKVWTGIPETTLFRTAMFRFLGDEMQSPRKNDSFLKKYFTWDENDTKQSFHVLRQRHGLPKPDEATYFKGNEVVKYFVDKKRVTGKVERAKLLKGFVPEIIKVSDNFFTYKYVDGKLLSECGTDTFVQFLDFMQANIWKPIEYPREKFVKACEQFYLYKTDKRVRQFEKLTGIYDKREYINGEMIPSISDMMEDIKWSWLCDGIPCLWHGDPQPENVILIEDDITDGIDDTECGAADTFCLLDWREDFGGLTECGDVYYDLAKVYHALLVSGKIIRDGRYSVNTNSPEYTIEYDEELMRCKDIMEGFIKDNDYDLKKVRMLSGLIYLNIAPLHQDPYNKFLYYFGKKYLHELLGER